MSCGIHRQILCSPICRYAKCQFCNVIRCGKIFVFSTKNHQKMISLNLPFLLNEATFEIYSYERVLQFRFSKALWKESAKYFILCEIVDWHCTCRRKSISLRILIKVILKHPRFVQNSTFQKSLADLHAGFQTDPTNTFWKGYSFCQNSPLSKHELYGRLINTH